MSLPGCRWRRKRLVAAGFWSSAAPGVLLLGAAAALTSGSLAFAPSLISPEAEAAGTLGAGRHRGRCSPGRSRLGAPGRPRGVHTVPTTPRWEAPAGSLAVPFTATALLAAAVTSLAGEGEGSGGAAAAAKSAGEEKGVVAAAAPVGPAAPTATAGDQGGSNAAAPAEPPAPAELADDKVETPPPVSGGADDADGSARIAKALRRLTDAEKALRSWSCVAEVCYLWLGVISIVVALFSYSSRGGRVNASMGMGLTCIVGSCICAAVGWWQARGCRVLSRRCGLAASSLSPEMASQPSAQLITVVPPLAMIETRLRNRRRTAWIGAMLAIFGMHTMVGLLVAKVLTTTAGGMSVSRGASGLSIDAFTLLSATNCALMHMIGAGIVGLQRSLMPAPTTPAGWVRGWDC